MDEMKLSAIVFAKLLSELLDKDKEYFVPIPMGEDGEEVFYSVLFDGEEIKVFEQPKAGNC